MPDFTAVRPCALIVTLLCSCGEHLTLDTGRLLGDEPLTISGQVLDGEGRPLWHIDIVAVEQRTNHAPAWNPDQPHTGTDVYGHYDLQLDAVGPMWLHFGNEERTFAWIEVEAGEQHDIDVVIAEDDVVHCQLFNDRGTNDIAQYSLWAHGPSYGYGLGGGCISSHGTCGPDALTFIWPSGYQTVGIHMGKTNEIVLTRFDQPCVAHE